MQIEVLAPQGTEEWFEDRRGKITASRTVDILKGLKGRYLAARGDYISELALERVTGVSAEGPKKTADMIRGTEMEPLARSEYEVRTGLMVQEVGFVEHPRIKMFGGSPDGLVIDDGGLEIKCPKSATHLKTLQGAPINRGYVIQSTVGMMCTERYWWDFVSYDPRFPEASAYFCKRLFRDDVLVKEIETEVKIALELIEEAVEFLKNYENPNP